MHASLSGFYDLAFSGIYTIRHQGWRSFARKVRIWFRLRRAPRVKPPPLPQLTSFLQINEAISEINKHIDSAKFGDFLTLVDQNKIGVYNKLRHEIGDVEAKILLLKITNLLVAKYEYLHRHTYLLSYPILINLDPANGCNLHCPGCVHTKNPVASVFLWPPGNLTMQSYKKFIDEYGPYAIQVIFCNWGEPFLNRMTPEFIKMASRYLLDTYISTNLSIRKLDVEKIVLSGLYYLTLSIDGAHKETYSMYRRGGDFDLVIDNVRRLVAAKKKLNSYTPVLEWQFLVFQHNIHEVKYVKEFARGIGVDRLHLKKPSSVSWDDPSITIDDSFKERYITYHCDLTSERDYYNKILADLDNEGIHRHFSRSWRKRYEQVEERFSDAPSAINPTCEWLYKNITLDAVGRIMPCCMSPAKDQNLVYSKIESPCENCVSTHDLFNSDSYVLSRLSFRDNATYKMKIKSLENENRPFCGECPALQLPKPNAGTEQIRSYLYKVDIYGILSEESKDILANWPDWSCR